ncbi:MAG: preprotein translocase subunit SecE [Candidatus Babeliales bacterium]
MKDIGRFLREVRSEMGKVTWPSFRELVGSTIIVLILVCFFAVYLGAIDFLFARLAKWMYGAYSGLR